MLIPTTNLRLNWANARNESDQFDKNLSTIVRFRDVFPFNMDVSKRGILPCPNLLQKVQETKDEPKPFVAILNCMDSWAPPELLYDQYIGDIFNICAAGNVVSQKVFLSFKIGKIELYTVISLELNTHQEKAYSRAASPSKSSF